MRTHTLVAAALVATAAIATAPSTSTAAGSVAAAGSSPRDPHVVTLADGLVGPLRIAVRDNGAIFYSENFAGALHLRGPGGRDRVVFRAKKPGHEVGAVSDDHGRVRFAVSGNNTALLKAFGPRGNARTIADLGKFEQQDNPDAGVTYGFVGLSDSCAEQLPPQVGPAQYTGIVDAHPYATVLRGRTTYVADAAGNDIVKVSRSGKVSAAAVLPPVPTKITASGAEASGLPPCTVGKTYRFEAVPTDLEEGPGAWLYATCLPGGPEDPSLGARGVVVKVNPRTGKVVTIARGLLSPTGLAVAGNGDLYVAELFGGRIVKIKAGTQKVRTVLEAALPGEVELDGGSLLATTDVFPPEQGAPDGKVVRIRG